jgi:hypothetical protein
LLVIAVAYTSHVSVIALVIALVLYALLLALRWWPFARGPLESDGFAWPQRDGLRWLRLVVG